MTPAEHLPSEWRTRADQLRPFNSGAAAAFEECAKDLEAELRLWREEPLTLAEAADVSGYSADHLGRMVREGKIPNAGRPKAPRVRRVDLPTKPKRTPPVAKEASPGHRTNAQIVQSIIDQGVA